MFSTPTPCSSPPGAVASSHRYRRSPDNCAIEDLMIRRSMCIGAVVGP
jgi:hypothetical protein